MLPQRYVASGVTFRSSRLVRTENTLILTLGTADGTTAATTSSGPVQWRPATGATDRAGNPLPTTARTSDSADAGF